MQVICASVEGVAGAEYVVGVDVHGNAVAPADLSSPLSEEVAPVVIPIELDLLKRFGLNVPVGIELSPVVGEMQIYPDGRVTYNKTDITRPLNVLCNKNAEKESDDQGKPHGHMLPNPVPSSDKIEGEYPVNQSK